VQEYPGPPTDDPVRVTSLPPAAELQWRPLGGLATSLTWLLALDVLAGVFAIVAILQRLGIIDDVEQGNFSFDLIERAQNSDDLVGAASIVFLILMLATGVCFIVWMWRAAKDNEALGRRGARFGPGWAIGSWFIPLANFVIPVMMMQGLWRGSDPAIGRDDEWKYAQGSGLVGLWWTFWVLQSIRLAGGGSTEDGVDISDVRTSNQIVLVGFAFGIVAAVLAILVVRRLSERQEQCLLAQQAAWAQQQNTPPPVV
jgi:hypothetical protein